MKIISMTFRLILLLGILMIADQSNSFLSAQTRTLTEMEKVLREREAQQKKIERERAVIIKDRMKLLLKQTLDGNVNPNEYVVGPGDLFSIYIWGKVDRQFEAIVSPEGNLEIPTVGSVFVGGSFLDDGKNKILDKCKKVYHGVDISVTLTQLRMFRIYVTGNVLLPGTYPVRGVDRISDAIEVAGGLRGFTDGSSILITSKDGTTRSFDYLKYVYEGDLTNNFLLSNGDVIHVPTLDWSGNIVTIETYDNRSGSFNLKEGENLTSLLKRSGVFSRMTNTNEIYVARQNGKNEEIYPVGRTISKMDTFYPLSGDRIIIPILSSMVFVTGEVVHPGAYPYLPDLTAKDYVGYAGGVKFSGSLRSLKIIRDGQSLKASAELIVRRGDTVNISRKWTRLFREMFDVIFPITSIILSAKAAGLLN